MAKLLIYRASAGSGKTHTLVTRYIEWALRYPDAFKHILAVTFTNRATQEMKERILAYLYRLSIGAEKGLQERLCQAGWTPMQLQLRSKEVLSMMVYQYGDFSVTTIDSFFYKIIQAFAQSLGLPDDFSIEMDAPLALQETIENLCSNEQKLWLQKWIVDFALTKLVAGKSWNIKSNIQELGKALFDESFKIHEKTLLTAFQRQAIWSEALLATQTSLHSFEQRMQKIGQNALKLLKEEGLTPEDFSYGTKGVIGYFLKLASKKDFQPTKRALIASDALKSWYNTSKTNQATHITSVIQNTLHPLLMEAITLYAQEGLAYRTAKVAARFTYAFGMIGALLIGLEQYRSRHNLLFMSDLSALLYHAIQQNHIPFLYEKIGKQFHHFLIDEFQDLSLFQWMNIKPLLHNSLAQGYTSLLVGDVKQSIYRWRGSNWKILNHEVEAAYKESNVYHLNSNRRSQKAIVLFNNYFFKKAASQLVDYLESIFPAIDPLPYELAQMRRAYDDVAQTTETQKGGYVELLLLTSEQTAGDPMDWQTQAQKVLVALIEKLQQEGLPAKDIVVLVRNNNEASLLTGWFSHTTGPYKVQSDHADAVWNHAAIKVLIHALYYLNNEDDLINRVAWVEAYCSCMDKDLGMGPHDRFHQAIDGSMEKLLPRSFWVQKDFLKNLSIYSCLELLISCLFPAPHNFGDLFAFFQSMVLHFSLTESTSTAAFLAWWEKRGRTIKLPTSQDKNRIKVMTIHQAKGLAFKVVVMPFCSWGLDHPNGPILWSTNHAHRTYFPIWPVRYGTDLKETDYAKDYYLEQMQIYLDNLNLLYVAFTRAEAQLYVMAPRPTQNTGITTIAELIYQSLANQKMNPLSEQKVPWVVDVEETALATKFSFR